MKNEILALATVIICLLGDHSNADQKEELDREELRCAEPEKINNEIYNTTRKIKPIDESTITTAMLAIEAVDRVTNCNTRTEYTNELDSALKSLRAKIYAEQQQRLRENKFEVILQPKNDFYQNANKAIETIDNGRL